MRPGLLLNRYDPRFGEKVAGCLPGFPKIDVRDVAAVLAIDAERIADSDRRGVFLYENADMLNLIGQWLFICDHIVEQQLEPSGSSVSDSSMSCSSAISSLQNYQLISLALIFSSVLLSSVFLNRNTLFQPKITRSRWVSSVDWVIGLPFLYRWHLELHGSIVTIRSWHLIIAWFFCISLPPKIMSHGGSAPIFPTLTRAKIERDVTFFDEDLEFSIHHEIFRNVFEEWRHRLFLFNQFIECLTTKNCGIILFTLVFMFRVQDFSNYLLLINLLLTVFLLHFTNLFFKGLLLILHVFKLLKVLWARLLWLLRFRFLFV